MVMDIHKNTSAICREHFSSVTFDDAELQAQILDVFEQQIDGFWSDVASVSSPDALRGVLHRFKGSARGIGAFALGDALEEGESLVATDRSVVFERIHALVEAVKLDLTELRAARTGQTD